MMRLSGRRLTITGLLLLMLCADATAQKVNKDSLRQVISSSSDDTIRVDAMNRLALYILNHEQSELHGLALLDSTLAEAQRVKYYGGIGQTMITRGGYFRRNGKWQEAISTFKELISLPAPAKDSLRQAKVRMMANNNLAGIHNINGDYATALEYRMKSLHLAEKLGSDSMSSLIIYTNIASDYRQLRLFAKAKEYLDTASLYQRGVKPSQRFDYLYERHSLAQSEADTTVMGSTLREMESVLGSASLSKYQQLDMAQEYHKLKGSFFRDHKKQYGDATLAHIRALELAEALQEEKKVIAALYNLAHTYVEAGNTDVAIPMLQQSYARGMQLNVPFNSEKSARLLSAVYEQKGLYAMALDFRKRAEALHDSLDLDEKLKEVNFLEAKYQNEKKAGQIATLEKDNLQKEIGLSRQRLLLWISVGAVIALLTISLLLYRLNHHRRLLSHQQQQIQEEKIQSLEQQQQVLSLQAMVNGQETERVRIAKDLHDGLGGLFSTVKMHYSSLQRDTPDLLINPLYKKTLGLIDNAAGELRRVAHNMMPEVLMKVGLEEALTDLCNNVTAGGQLTARLQAYGLENRLERSGEVLLYRIIQELLNNIVKHAGASEAIIQINRQAAALTVIVEDNGRGFDVDAANAEKSMGMSTVKSRVDYLNGQLTIDSIPSVGTTVTIEIPLTEKQPA